MDAAALQAAAAASAASYRSFAEATRHVLDLLHGHLPSHAAVYLSHLDRAQDLHRIVDARNGTQFNLRSNVACPLAQAYDLYMAEDRAPRLCGDLDAVPAYACLEMHERLEARSYLGVPLELSDGSRVGAIAAVSRKRNAFNAGHLQLVAMLARVLAYELERETNERDLRRLNEAMRSQARGIAAVGRVARALSGTDAGDARRAVCEAACEAAAAQVAFLLEPRGRDYVSTAMYGIVMDPVTILPRDDDPSGVARAFEAQAPLFVSDVRTNAALTDSLVEATDARSAVFEPVTRDGSLGGVLIVIWSQPVPSLPESVAAALRLVAAEAAVAIEQEGLRARVDSLALADGLTGLPTGRVWETEVPRELARARRHEMPVCVAMLDVDHLARFNLRRGDQEGDRLLKEASALWLGQLREVDLLARVDGATFGVLLPNCTLTEAIDVLDRLRGATPRGQTASAGVARWDAAEPADLLVARATGALSAAKAAGRDMTLAAD